MSIRVAGRYGFTRPPMMKLFDQILTVAGNFDITGIPPSFHTLILHTLFRGDIAAISDGVDIFFNGDTTAANYERTSHGAGTAHTSATASNAGAMTTTAASSPANSFVHGIATIIAYANAELKEIIIQESRRADAANTLILQKSMQWENVAAINQITIQPDNYATDLFDVGSQLVIYGVY